MGEEAVEVGDSIPVYDILRRQVRGAHQQFL